MLAPASITASAHKNKLSLFLSLSCPCCLKTVRGVTLNSKLLAPASITGYRAMMKVLMLYFSKPNQKHPILGK